MDDKSITVTEPTQLQQNFVPQLADRLAKALANSGRLELDGNNQFHHYQYPTVAQVRGHANKALSAAGLGIIPEITHEGRTTRETDKGRVSNVTFVKLSIHVFAPEGMFTVRWIGESEDMTDKGIAKAVSAGIKSFLLAMMLMPVGEEENDDGETDAKKAQRKPAPPKQSKPAQPPAVDYDGKPLDAGPKPKDEYTTTSAPAEPVPDENAKPAKLKYQPFVSWCNDWVLDARAAKYAKEHGAGELAQANMWHILQRVGKLGFAEVTAENVEQVKATLQKYIESQP